MQQQQAALDAIRPELVLSGWRVEIEKDANKFSLLFIDAVRNIGVGPAFRVLVYAPQPERKEKRLTVITDVNQIAVLAKDEKVSLDAIVRLAFKSESKSPSKILPLEVHLIYSDLRGNRFRTVYNVLASDQPVGLTERLGPGVSLRHRETSPDSKRRWWWPFLWPLHGPGLISDQTGLRHPKIDRDTPSSVSIKRSAISFTMCRSSERR
jgi:hypothetical protein